MSSKYDNLLAKVPTDLWIGGKWRKASDGGRFDVLDPATDNKIASVASATVEDAKAAVDAASDAFAGCNVCVTVEKRTCKKGRPVLTPGLRRAQGW
jgi:hypothetical protein